MTALILANTQIRQDAAGRFCLNDLHQASGGANKHRPSLWMDNRQTQALIAEIEAETAADVAGIPATVPAVETISDGFAKGTYAVKELVYAYAMWISAAFHLHVIRAYDAMVTAQRADLAPPLPLAPQHRADQFVSAGRIFSAAMRTARTLRMPPAQAIRAAVDCAARHTGINLGEEIGVDVNTLGHDEAMRTPLVQKISDYAATRSELILHDMITDLELGDPRSMSARLTASRILTGLGFRSKRRRHPAGGFYSPWKRVLTA